MFEPTTLFGYQVLAWTYAVFFSLATYFQAFAIWRWRTTKHTTLYWFAFTAQGFMLLAICTTVTYFSDVRQIIEENYQDSFYPIQLSDFVIAVNGLIASVIMCFFSCKYRDRREYVKNSIVIGIVSVLCWIGLLFSAGFLYWDSYDWDIEQYLLSFMVFYVFTIMARFPPQIAEIFRARSTHGWSMEYTACQLVGGWILLSQVAYDMLASGLSDWSPANVLKTMIGVLIIFFSVIIIIQHYTCCRDKFPHEISRSQLKTEKMILEERICYDETPHEHSYIGVYQIIDDYDPVIHGRVSETPSGEVYISLGEETESGIFTDHEHSANQI